METKRIEVTDTTLLGEGSMVAYASTFGNVDAQGDRVVRGAFTETVSKIRSGSTLPLIWGHEAHGSPQNFIGSVTDATEDAEGLQIVAHFDMQDPVGLKAWRLVRSGAIDKLSIGYTVPAGGRRRASDGANELHKIDLHEVSLVLTPANDQARVLAIKGNYEHDQDYDDDYNAVPPSNSALADWAKRLGVAIARPGHDALSRALLDSFAKARTQPPPSLAGGPGAEFEHKNTAPIRLASFEC